MNPRGENGHEAISGFATSYGGHSLRCLVGGAHTKHRARHRAEAEMQRRELLQLRRQAGKRQVPRQHRHLLLRCHWGLFVVVATLVSQTRAMDAATFKSKYLAAAAKLEDAYGHCRINTTTITTNDKDDRWFTTTFRLTFAGELIKCEHEHEDATGKSGRTISGTPTVNFMILRLNDKEPMLENVDRTSIGYYVARRQISARADTPLKAFSLLGAPISERLRSDQFKIQSIEELGDSLKVNFQSDEETVSLRGWFAVLPNRDWVLDSWEVVLSRRDQDYIWRKNGKATYTANTPVPNLSSIESHSYHPDRTDTELTTVDFLKFDDVPEAEFMLSHYGYSDEIGKPAGFFHSLPFLLAVCGTLCLLSVALFRYRWKRTS